MASLSLTSSLRQEELIFVHKKGAFNLIMHYRVLKGIMSAPL